MTHPTRTAIPDDTVSNASAAPTISQLMAARMTRRTALQGMAVAGVYSLLGCATPTPQSASKAALTTLTFTELGRFLDETHHVAPGYHARTLLRWGDPLHTDAPAFNPQQQNAAAQERQFGANNDYVAQTKSAAITGYLRRTRCGIRRISASLPNWPWDR